MDYFKYEPIDLEGPAFRLLRLFRGRETDIECELFQAWLHSDSAISYDALSYTWGGIEMSASIKINGRTLNVTENLYLALQYLRSQETDRILWVDAICINQSNKKERGHQVQQMGDIYSQADQVVLWLGPATDETGILMDSLKQLEQESIKYVCKDWKHADERWKTLWSSIQPMLKNRHWNLEFRQRAGLDFLLWRPWFKRVWILQEVANAKRAIVCSGTKFVSARIFALAPLLVGTKPDPHCQAVLDIMPGPSRKDSWWSQKQDIYTLLLKFNGSKASDPRDKIYALLGISSDGRDANSLRADYTKTPQEVVHDATLSLFDLPDSPHHTMQEFLSNFTSLNTAYLSRVARSDDASVVASFLKRRGDNVNITGDVLQAAAGNAQSGKEVMAFLLKQRGDEVKITEGVVKVAAGNRTNGKEVMELLLRQRGDEVKITEEVVKSAAGNKENGKGVMQLLLEQRGEEVVKAAARNTESGKGVMELLLRPRGEGLEITQRLVAEMARLFNAGCIALLLKQRRDQVKITEEVVKAAAGNLRSGKEVMELLLRQRGDEVKITEKVVKAAAGNWRSGKEVMELLLRQRGDEVKITEKVVKAAAGNRTSGKRVMEILLKQRVDGFEITQGLVVGMARLFDAECMALLLEQRGDEVKITEEVVKAAAGNRTSGNRVMELLLKQRVDGFEITQGLVAEMARLFNTECMALLLKQRRDQVKITEEVVKAAAENRTSGNRVMEILLKQRGDEVKITEEVVKSCSTELG